MIDDKWNYAKNVNDQGIFETIWGGTAAGMGAKGKGLMQPDDPSVGLTADEMLKVVAFIRSNAIDAVKSAEAAPSSVPASETPKAELATAAVAATTAGVAKSASKAVKRKAKKVKAKTTS